MKGKLERSDRGDQIIAQEIEPLVLNDESNRPKVFEIMIPSARFSQSNMARLATVLSTNPGGDRVELFIEQGDGQTMRAGDSHASQCALDSAYCRGQGHRGQQGPRNGDLVPDSGGLRFRCVRTSILS